jgi:hypothetical protein
MGEIYRARDSPLERDARIDVRRSGVTSNPENFWQSVMSPIPVIVHR